MLGMSARLSAMPMLLSQNHVSEPVRSIDSHLSKLFDHELSIISVAKAVSHVAVQQWSSRTSFFSRPASSKRLSALGRGCESS